MKLIAIFRYFMLVPSFLAGFGLSSFALKAQTFIGRNTLAESPTSLRSSIIPVPNSPMIQIRFEHTGRGPVRIRIRNEKGTVLLDEVASQPKYAGQFDFGALPTGIYTIELTTSEARYREKIRIEPPTAGRVITFSTPEQDSLFLNQ
ncbi:hypothetical protein GCM10028805_57820 [Spirosoma harenae]